MMRSPRRSGSRPSASARSCARRSRSASDEDSDHAKLQLARLRPAMKIATDAIEGGDVGAIPSFLKVLDRLDHYQKTAKVNQVYDDDARRKLSRSSTASRQSRPRRHRNPAKAQEERRARAGADAGNPSPAPPAEDKEKEKEGCLGGRRRKLLKWPSSAKPIK